MDEMTLTLNSPLTEEEWDLIEDVDFDHTNSITFHTNEGRQYLKGGSKYKEDNQ